jgi:hypothetical protein
MKKNISVIILVLVVSIGGSWCSELLCNTHDCSLS